MEIWCLDTFSQQQSKVFTKEFLHYLIDSLTLGESGKTERKREGEGGTKEETINLHDTSFKSVSSTRHILGAGQHRGQGWAPTEPRHPQGQVHMEDGAKGVGKYTAQEHRPWSQAEFKSCLYNLVVLCPLQVT